MNGSVGAAADDLSAAICEVQVALTAVAKVRAETPLGEGGATLTWMKHDGAWALWVTTDRSTTPLVKASIEQRVAAVAALPALREAMTEAHASTLAELLDAAEAARAFARSLQQEGGES